MPVVVTDIARADPEAVAALARHGCATVHEAQGRVGLMAPRLRPVWPGASACGTAVTVAVPPGDNWMIHVAIEQCQAGDVLVVAPISASQSGYFGDLLATSLMARGVRGLVIDAGVRDVADLERMGFPVWAACISSHGTVKETLGDVNLPLSCGGQIVRPGDVVLADVDGVVIVPRLKAADVATAADAREAKEAVSRQRYAGGELGLDVNGMRPRLAERGLTWRRQTEEDRG